jgi:uncharacterized BrkB/YihY/UPF0761 family membrane protein
MFEAVQQRRSWLGHVMPDPRPTVSYLFSLESHVYSFAIAANVLLSFFPFLVLVLTLLQHGLQMRGAAEVVYLAVRDFLPEDPGLEEFVIAHLKLAVQSRGQAAVVSALMLVFSSNGIFVPLEVALNRLFGFTADRPYWKNQIISLGLAVACGALALLAALSVLKAADVLQVVSGAALLPRTARFLALKLVGIPFSALPLFLVYWALPNGRVPARRALGFAVVVGLLLELGKDLYVLIWPYLGFRQVYGPFFISITLLMLGYAAAMVVLAGAELMARPR